MVGVEVWVVVVVMVGVSDRIRALVEVWDMVSDKIKVWVRG